jgi:hypothetical protein
MTILIFHVNEELSGFHWDVTNVLNYLNNPNDLNDPTNPTNKTNQTNITHLNWITSNFRHFSVRGNENIFQTA